MAQPKLDRLVSIDALRGIAVLGILMMNVQAFAMIPQAYELPTAHMDLTGANLTVWWIAHTFFSMKFITIFSALFGAGIILMVGEGDTRIHYRRMLWLLAIGMIHAYIFWYGDILVSYALIGMIAVLARRWSARTLGLVGVLLVTVTGLVMVGAFATFQFIPGGADPVEMGMALSDEDRAEWVATFQAGFVDHIVPNALMALMGQAASLLFFGGRLLGVMFIGMALFKGGFFQARWPMLAYLLTGLPALAVGLGLSAWSSDTAIADNFALETAWAPAAANYAGSLLAALGYACVVMMIAKLPWMAWFTHVFAATGRMAFTNYLTQTLIMTFIFVGPPGLGLFGTVERVDQAKLVMLVWALQLIWSPLWLAVFRFGPLEWAWRSLTYWKPQPMLKAKPVPAAG